MKLNEQTALSTNKILLVPYSAHHVPTYHEWMQSPALQAATASEPLTLEQEYEMQRSWRRDGDKLTFIACLAPEADQHIKEGEVDGGGEGKVVVCGGVEGADGSDRMVGDVNLFLSEAEDEDEDALGAGEDEREIGCVGEVEIMVASVAQQNQGLGTSILLTFLWYILTRLPTILTEYSTSMDGKLRVLRYLRVKIDAGNARSIKLFERAGFRKISEVPNYFNELELRYEIPEQRELEEVAKVLGIEQPKVVAYRLS